MAGSDYLILMTFRRTASWVCHCRKYFVPNGPI